MNQVSCLQPQATLRNGPPVWAVLLLFVPIFRNTVLIRQREDVSNYTGIDIWATIDIIALGLCLLVMIRHFHLIPWQKIRCSCFKWWLIYYVFCLFSIFWCIEGSNPYYILFRAGSMLIFSFYIFWLMSNYHDPKSAFDGLMKYISVIMILGLLGQIKFGDFHTNSYSCSAAVLAIMALTVWRVNYLIAGVVCLILGTSGGSNTAFACGLVFWLFSAKKSGFSIVGFGIAMIVIFFGYCFFFADVMALLFPGKSMEAIESGTGRFQMWQVYLDAWKLQPWLGYGFAVGERAGEVFGYIYTLSAHNGFLSVLINTGVAGCVIWGSFFFRFLFNVICAVRQLSPYAAPVAAAMVVITVNNLTVPIIGSVWGSLATVALLVISFAVLFIKITVKGKEYAI